MANEEYIVHRAADWHIIGDKMPHGEGTPQEEFKKHLLSKASRAINKSGSDFPFGETVTKNQAEVIRYTAKKNDIREVKGGSST